MPFAASARVLASGVDFVEGLEGGRRFPVGALRHRGARPHESRRHHGADERDPDQETAARDHLSISRLTRSIETMLR
jgi:hypothetical protein